MQRLIQAYISAMSGSRETTRKGVSLPLALVAVLIAIGIGALLWRQTTAPTNSSAQQPDQADHVLPEGDTVQFDSLDQLAATARLVVRAEVVDVVKGESVALTDSSNRTVTPRFVILRVDDVLNSRTSEQVPDQIKVNDGFWEKGEGYAREGLDWANEGASGYYFLSQDRDPNGKTLTTYSVLSTSGRVLFHDDHTEHADTEIWDAIANNESPEAVDEAIAKAIESAQSGATKPVPIRVCYPSIPGDEKSDPICEEQ